MEKVEALNVTAPSTKDFITLVVRCIAIFLLCAATLFVWKYLHDKSIETQVSDISLQHGGHGEDQLGTPSPNFTQHFDNLVLSGEDAIEEFRDSVFEKSYESFEFGYLDNRELSEAEKRAKLLVLSHHATECFLSLLRSGFFKPIGLTDDLKLVLDRETFAAEVVKLGQQKCLRQH